MRWRSLRCAVRSISERRFWEARSLPGERVRGRGLKFARGAVGVVFAAEEEEESGGGELVVCLACFDGW